MKLITNGRTCRAGMTLLEMTFASAIISVILLSSFALLGRDSHLAHSTLGISIAEMKAQQMLRKVEGELSDVRGATLNAIITAECGANQTSFLQVDSTLGFPDEGMLLIARGTPNEERVRYSGLNAAGRRFLNLERGLDCTGASTQTRNTDVMWIGLAEPIELQNNPPANLWDGVAMEPTGPTFFRGDGAGFSYRGPTDVTGGTNYLNGDDIQWGATVNNVPTATGWEAITYVPRFTYVEAETNDDINRDGDFEDTFDVGQLRRRVWDTSNPGAPALDIGLGPTNLLQERCDWGSDLDNDGFDDPMFLWDPGMKRLHIRLFVLGTGRKDIPIVRRVESMVFLRNHVQE